ncbi:hypothetical protein FHQ18_09385 [Deferribacter autotrophicus]|uniref:Uncharacterized protein n=1 Tax=Deferribacter autotrophicus TaxID=500465 RepID=A0A5A8F291_9BACT|nr:hypothetical protein [Deferribacter autotrophicus]KAA0257545.1 hypothetical protein FHQ18_09385 [Deferribacter autotrophicus]
MAVLVITENNYQTVFPSIKEASPFLKEIVQQYGKIKQIITDYSPKTPHGSCPECGSPMAFEEGCRKCHSCGYSLCG